MREAIRSTVLRTTMVATTALVLGACADPVTTEPAVTAQGEPTLARGGSKGGNMPMQEGALYVANLHPLNARVQQQLDPDRHTPHGVTTGKAYFRVVNGMLHAVVDVAGAEPEDGEPFPEGLHPQHIHAADRCPPMSADTNGDNIVDVIEGVPFYGPIMIPLDGDINNTTSEIPTFPVARGARGTYHYEATGSVATLEAMLGHALNLETRHVVVHGVDLDTPLPATVQTLGGLPPQVTLPVACGEIRRMR